jgi:hypothetical protein
VHLSLLYTLYRHISLLSLTLIILWWKSNAFHDWNFGNMYCWPKYANEWTVVSQFGNKTPKMLDQATCLSFMTDLYATSVYISTYYMPLHNTSVPNNISCKTIYDMDSSQYTSPCWGHMHIEWEDIINYYDYILHHYSVLYCKPNLLNETPQEDSKSHAYS